MSKSALLREELNALVAQNRMLLVMAGLVLSWLGCSWVVLLFEAGDPNAQIDTYGKALWWGIVTFMTVGYGDLAPVTVGGRITAGLLMFSGVTCIGIVSAKISAYFLRQVLLEGRGAVDRTKVRNHFIVCGWKDDMPDLLRHILAANRSLKANHLVIVANRTPEQITALKSDAKLADVTVIVGDYFQQETLRRAAPENARKVLILADSTTDLAGRKTSVTEADARTIMTAIALSNIAKGTVAAAEIVDPSLDHYLKLAGVSEIIYSREYSRLLLGSAASGTGLVNVFHDLVDPSTGAFITTEALPERWAGTAYGLFRSEFQRQHADMLVIGILENSGNPHKIKELAFDEAQKTPSIGRLIENLQTVKSLRCNNPVFHPREDYIIGKGCAVIVLVNEHAASARFNKILTTETDTIAA